VVALVLIVCALTLVDNWPQWRGPRGQGVSDEKNLPLEWSPTKNTKWKARPKHELVATNSLGEPVYASPAVSGGRIFIRGERSLYCIGN
jgi:hypothetical protein